MTSVNSVSRHPAKVNYKPLTWENSVSEDRLHQEAHTCLPRTSYLAAATD